MKPPSPIRPFIPVLVGVVAPVALSVPIGPGVALSNIPAVLALLLIGLVSRFYLRPAIQSALQKKGAQQP